MESNSDGEGEGDDAEEEEEDNEVTDFWLELSWIQLFVLDRRCRSGTKKTRKNTKASRGGSELRLEAARPLVDDEAVNKCVLRDLYCRLRQ